MFPNQNNNNNNNRRGGAFGSGYGSGYGSGGFRSTSGSGGNSDGNYGGNRFYSQHAFPTDWRFRVIRPPPIRGTESKTIVLPESVMQGLLQQNVPTPWFFEVENPRSSKKIIVGAPHFELAENGVGLPLWMRKAVGVDLMDFVDVRSIPQPPNATAVVVRGLKSDYADIPNIDQDIRQRLTDALSEYSTLNKGSVIPLRLEPSAFATQHEFKIESLFSNGVPVNQASIIGVGHELHVEFDKPYQGKHAYKLGGDDEDDETSMRPGFVSSTGFQFNRHGLPLLPSTLERMTPSEGERFMRGPSPTPLPPRRLSNRVSPPASPPRPRFARAPETLTTTTLAMRLPESRSRMAYQTGEMEDRQDDAKRRATSRNNDSNAALLRYESIIAARRSPVLVDRQEEQVEEDEEIYIFEYDDDDEDEEEEEDDEIMNVD